MSNLIVVSSRCQSLYRLTSSRVGCRAHRLFDMHTTGVRLNAFTVSEGAFAGWLMNR